MNAVWLNDKNEYYEKEKSKRVEEDEDEDILTFVAVVGGGSGGRSTFIYTHRLDFDSIE